MNLALFYDTETTGLPLFSEPSEDPRQPHIVEFAATLVDLDLRRSIASAHLVARPDGWEIPEEVAAIHGITTEYAMRVGVDERYIIETMLNLHRLANVRVGHNQSFDARIIRIGLKRFGFGDAIADEFKAAPALCTASMARPHTKLPKNKMPTLGEAYRHFTGEDFPEAHSAKADTSACAEVFFAIRAAEQSGSALDRVAAQADA